MTCKRCRKKLPRIGLLHGDPYCSVLCCRLDHGLDPPPGEEQGGRRCRGCGCSCDDRTVGCDNCTQRHHARSHRVAA